MQYNRSLKSCFYRHGKNGKNKLLNTRRKTEEYTLDFTYFLKLCKITQGSNNPNILTTNKRMPATFTLPNRREKGGVTESVLKTDMQPPAVQPDLPPKKEGAKAKQCYIHDLNGHTLEECLAFCAKSLDEDQIASFSLTLLSLPVEDTASNCKENTECTICRDKRHPALLHRKSVAAVDSKCTLTCKAMEGGILCTKLLLVDVFGKEKLTQPIECTPL